MTGRGFKSPPGAGFFSIKNEVIKLEIQLLPYFLSHILNHHYHNLYNKCVIIRETNPKRGREWLKLKKLTQGTITFCFMTGFEPGNEG